MTESCLILIKPDGIIKSLTGNIITALSETRLKIIGAKVIRPKRETVEKHYENHKAKPFFNELVDYLMGKYHTDRVLALIYNGDNAIEKIRKIVGGANPEDAEAMTIRNRYGRINSKTKVFENVIHASDCKEAAEREIKLWFAPNEIVETIYPTKNETFKNSGEQEIKIYKWA